MRGSSPPALWCSSSTSSRYVPASTLVRSSRSTTQRSFGLRDSERRWGHRCDRSGRQGSDSRTAHELKPYRSPPSPSPPGTRPPPPPRVEALPISAIAVASLGLRLRVLPWILGQRASRVVG